MEFWLNHPRKILVFYLIGAVFLPMAYESGMSTDFVIVDIPSNINQVIKSGYRVWVNQATTIRRMAHVLPEQTKNMLLKHVDVEHVVDLLTDKDDIKYPTTVREFVETMAKYKLMLPNGVEGLRNFPSLTYALGEHEVIVAEDDFVCGTLSLTGRYGFQQVSAYQIRGHMASEFLKLLAVSEETGMYEHFQGMILFQKAIMWKLKVEDLSKAWSTSTSAMRTPLGVVCIAYVGVNLTLLLCNIVWMLYFNWIAVRRVVVRIKRYIEVLTCRLNCFQTQVSSITTDH
ncbi:unnamed protein product [Orchesella dallaii]|uniref:Uncharacterized protein n=1 Tax=Orchesella dallaii TaxID=48710 RepID=A0ABP1PL92_9HEXA